MLIKFFFVYRLDGIQHVNSFQAPKDTTEDRQREFARQKIADEHGPLAAPEEATTIEQVAGDIKGRATILHIFDESTAIGKLLH